MIDLKQAEKIFLEETSQYDLQNENIKRKQLHSLRVMENAKAIAERLGLSKEQVAVSTLIGLLHDIGRFEQYTRYQTYSDQNSVDHGELGVSLLKENNRIRKYITEEQYDEIIFKAIQNHGKYQIQEGLSEEELLYAKLIRDADKLDILYEGCDIFWKNDIEAINESILSKEILEQIKKQETVLRKKGRSFQKIDSVVELMALVYDLNYKESFAILKEADYINQIANRFELQDQQSKEDFEWVRREINQYIQEKLEKK